MVCIISFTNLNIKVNASNLIPSGGSNVPNVVTPTAPTPNYYKDLGEFSQFGYLVDYYYNGLQDPIHAMVGDNPVSEALENDFTQKVLLLNTGMGMQAKHELSTQNLMKGYPRGIIGRFIKYEDEEKGRDILATNMFARWLAYQGKIDVDYEDVNIQQNTTGEYGNIDINNIDYDTLTFPEMKDFSSDLMDFCIYDAEHWEEHDVESKAFNELNTSSQKEFLQCAFNYYSSIPSYFGSPSYEKKSWEVLAWSNENIENFSEKFPQKIIGYIAKPIDLDYFLYSGASQGFTHSSSNIGFYAIGEDGTLYSSNIKFMGNSKIGVDAFVRTSQKKFDESDFLNSGAIIYGGTDLKKLAPALWEQNQIVSDVPYDTKTYSELFNVDDDCYLVNYDNKTSPVFNINENRLKNVSNLPVPITRENPLTKEEISKLKYPVVTLPQGQVVEVPVVNNNNIFMPDYNVIYNCIINNFFTSNQWTNFFNTFMGYVAVNKNTNNVQYIENNTTNINEYDNTEYTKKTYIPNTVKLENLFPFCLPFDVYNLIALLNTKAETPSFTISTPYLLTDNGLTSGYNLQTGDETKTELKFDKFDTLALILRTMILIIWSVILALFFFKELRK